MLMSIYIYANHHVMPLVILEKQYILPFGSVMQRRPVNYCTFRCASHLEPAPAECDFVSSSSSPSTVFRFSSSLSIFLIPQFLSSSLFKQYNNDIMPPSIHSNIAGYRLGFHPDCSTYPGNKQKKESKHIEKAASSTLPKKKSKQLFLQELDEDRRRVRFSIVKTAFLEDVPLASQMTETEKKNLWWRKDETAIAKQCIATICDTTPCRPNCLGASSSSSYISVLGRVYDQCHDSRTASSPVDENDQKLLSQWARNSHFRRGLETRIIGSTTSIRGEHRKAGRETLVYAVQLLHKNKMIDVETKAEVIRKCSERMSRGARLFAQSLAQADVESIKPRPKLSPVRRLTTLPKKLLSEYFVSFGSAQL
jgi:hypothetical protein